MIRSLEFRIISEFSLHAIFNSVMKFFTRAFAGGPAIVVSAT